MRKMIVMLPLVLVACNEKKVETPKTETVVKENVSVPVQNLDIKMEALQPSEIPGNLSYDGKIKFAKILTDRLGKHIILYCLTGEVPSKKSITGEPEKDSYLYIYDYVKIDDAYDLNWKIQDNISNCMFDLGMDFVDKAITATDLDHNNLAEIWNMYHLTCTSDVSPDNLKLIMYEGQKKYAMRGEEYVEYPSDEGTVTDGGTYKMDNAFKNSLKAFQDFAKDLWEKNKKLRSY